MPNPNMVKIIIWACTNVNFFFFLTLAAIKPPVFPCFRNIHNYNNTRGCCQRRSKFGENSKSLRGKRLEPKVRPALSFQAKSQKTKVKVSSYQVDKQCRLFLHFLAF